MQGIIGDAAWAAFLGAQRKAYDEFAQKTMVHLIHTEVLDIHHEQNNQPTYTRRELKILSNYNYMRTWPISKDSDAGELDKQSIQIFLNKQYLKELGYLTPDSNYDYEPALDRFELDGLIYKPFGDTAASQAGVGDNLYLIVLKREETSNNDQTLR